MSAWKPDPMSLRTMLGIALVINGYVLIYYRLLVRHFYQEQHGIKESTFGALFSFPPYARLSELGKKYARRYWVTLALLIVILLISAFVKEGPVWPNAEIPMVISSSTSSR
jgi:uncharacterized membrane protein HdeD (DUF308 family)